MINRIGSIFVFLAIAAIGFYSVNVQAYQPHYLDHKIGEIPKEGSAKQIVGSFTVRNITKQSMRLRLGTIEDRTYEFRLSSRSKELRPGEQATVQFSGQIRADGKYQINLPIGFLIGDGFGSEHVVDLYFLVDGGQYRLSTYEELYLQTQDQDREMGESFFGEADKGQFPRGPEYKRPLPPIDEMLKLSRKSIEEIPTDSADGECNRSTCPRPRTLEDYQAPEMEAPSPEAALARGRFNWRGMDNQLHPAYGWRVRAWQRFLGIWVPVAEDWIQWDGRWQLSIANSNRPTRFQYIAANRFFTPQRSNGTTYRWVGPVRSSISSNHNEGSWLANLSTGAARGLGEIYREGMNIWAKLYWEGNINPIRNSSIRVFFPNTTFDCGSGTGNPWSCASTNGRIWLIPAHASRNGVMQHELAHQINYEFWNNQLPSGSGGSHNLTDCYNPGLAVIEGFANFMVFWTQAARNSDPNAGFDFRVENPSFACSNPKNVNESWVAANFWDLHDYRGDGDDNLWFIHPGATPGIFLRAGRKSGKANFHPEYRSRANSSHRTIIDDIFRQDHIMN